MGKQKYNTETLKARIRKVHDDTYNLDKVAYTGYRNKITVTCPKHGNFEISICHILGGEGCPKCRYVKSSAALRRPLEKVIEEAIKVHGDKYDYSLITEYKNDRVSYPIRCKKHDHVFYQAFNNHIKGKQGCPICGRERCDKERQMTFEEYVEQASRVHSYYR